ncbi:MAG: esterase/lipase family protein [Thermotogota bacterium]
MAEENNNENKQNKLKNLISKLLLSLKRIRYKINKKILLIISGVVVLIIASFIFIPMIFDSQEAPDQKRTKELEVIIPENAYNGDKRFDIEEVPNDSIEYQNLSSMANFHGKIFSIEPVDGVEESSLLPMKIRYKIPDDLYFGDNFTNFSLAYASNSEPPVISEFSGAKIIEVDNSYYIEADTFHFSKIGLIVKSPKESDYGLKTLTEKPSTFKPDVLLVPGTDINFIGYLSNTNTSDNPYGSNFWSVLFEERTLWQYNYPIVNTRSKTYYDSYQGFLMRTGSKSYIEFEAKRLAQELKRLPNREFDIIAHGVGGLIARYAIESDENINNVKNIVLISTPNKGTNLANPLFFNLIYGKPTDILIENLNVNEEASFNIKYNTNFFLEQINNYYSDLIPNSEFLNKLNSFGLREDINYITIAGENSGINMDLSESSISRLYPEFINGKADGIVTVNSSLMNEANTKLLYDYKFYDIYSKPEVLDNIKKILEDTLEFPEIREFEDDDFIETYEQLRSSQEKNDSTQSQTDSDVDTESNDFNLPINYSEFSLIEDISTVKDLEYNNPKLDSFDGKLLIKNDSGIYDINGNILLNTDIINSYKYKDRYIVTAKDGIYVLDEDSNNFIKVEDGLIESDEAYYLSEYGILRVFHNNDYSSVYLDKEILSNNSRMVEIEENNGINYVVLENRISVLSENTLNDYILKDDIINATGISFDSIRDVEIINNDFYISTTDYKLIYVKGNRSFYQVIGNGDVGKKTLINKNGILYVFGEDTITYIDIENKNFPGNYQRFDEENIDYIINNETIYGIQQTLRGFKLWEGNLTNF